MKKLVIGDEPRLCLFATRQINPGDEITYNYGTMDYPWRQKRVCLNLHFDVVHFGKKGRALV